ncbi:MAG: hypothetical protein CM15mP74_18310 [Halieaceae bacterium]|nr:MAG: hypothetical protein CM15mP74_18310 [Halieaceae bacterium]
MLIDLTKRAANVDFTGVTPAEVFRGDAVAAALRDTLLIGALLTAAETTGAAGKCLNSITEYLKTRKQFGKLIGSYQALKHPTVDIYVGMENARSFVYHGATVVGEEALDQDAEVACRMAKVAADEVMVFAGDRSVQFHGGFGFTWECDSTLFIRRASGRSRCTAARFTIASGWRRCYWIVKQLAGRQVRAKSAPCCRPSQRALGLVVRHPKRLSQMGQLRGVNRCRDRAIPVDPSAMWSTPNRSTPYWIALAIASMPSPQVTSAQKPTPIKPPASVINAMVSSLMLRGLGMPIEAGVTDDKGVTCCHAKVSRTVASLLWATSIMIPFFCMLRTACSPMASARL